MNFGNMNLLGGAHLLQALGLNVGGVFQQLQSVQQQQMGMLQNMRDSFMFASGMQAGMLANLLQNGTIPGSGVTSPPNMGQCPCQGQYAQPQNFDLGATPGMNPFSLPALMQRGKAAQFEKFLQGNPMAKAQAEMLMGGKILPGAADGVIQVQPFSGGQNPSGSPAANNAMGFLDQIARAAMGLGMPGAGGANMFPMMMLGALGSLLGALGGGQGAGGQGGAGGMRQPGAGSPFVNWNENAGGGMRVPGGGGGAQGAGGAGGGFPGFGGPHQAGAPGPHQDKFGLGAEGDASGVLNDPGLTVEDKVTLMIMLIMKKMDKDIEKQANYINDLQQQQQGGGKGGGKGGGGSSPSIDIETMKLKRLIDKRGQMFDMLRQIIDKYNETAKNIIQSIGR